jgi:hypothetical protein
MQGQTDANGVEIFEKEWEQRRVRSTTKRAEQQETQTHTHQSQQDHYCINN